ncbi:MAG: PhoH family protein [Rhodobacteraceae bacterium]|nr:PhoH family protein [Paracoccaceae bacterium]
MHLSPLPAPPADAPLELLIEFPDNRLLRDLCGEVDRNLARVEHLMAVQILRRGNQLAVLGKGRAAAAEVLRMLYARVRAGKGLEPGDIDAAVRLGNSAGDTGAWNAGQIGMFRGTAVGHTEIRTRKKTVEPRTQTQQAYVRALYGHELTFGIGPAGTGKTYLAVAVAVNRMCSGHVDKIVLSRPAVEAGERLGFLPGDMKHKVDPYMQPLYDALSDFLPDKQLARLLGEQQIEIAPLAFMRGRTLSNACVVLDEAQNTTSMQMKMFLTRLGQGSRMVITGDRSQIDLPRGVTSGLVEAERILGGVSGISFTCFSSKDVVRHPMVARIIEAYNKDAPPG